MQKLWASTLVVFWWIGVWGITDWVIHHLSMGNAVKKILFYAGLLLMVVGTVYLAPDTLQYFQ